jgi:hypothetical protein
VVKKILKYIGIAVACIVVAALSSALLYRKYLQHKVAEELHRMASTAWSRCESAVLTSGSKYGART